jgi:hypothetical protein
MPAFLSVVFIAVPYEGLASPLRVTPGPMSGGKPVAMRRGPGRPRSRGGATQSQVRTKRPVGLKLKRWKGYVLLILCIFSVC